MDSADPNVRYRRVSSGIKADERKDASAQSLKTSSRLITG